MSFTAATIGYDQFQQVTVQFSSLDIETIGLTRALSADIDLHAERLCSLRPRIEYIYRHVRVIQIRISDGLLNHLHHLSRQRTKSART